MIPDFSEASLLAFFTQYIHYPYHIYGAIILFMMASSFGLPVPEELVLVSAGLVSYASTQAETSQGPVVDVYVLSIVCFFAVYASDLLVFFIGKFFGKRLLQLSFISKRVEGEAFKKIELWFFKYGGWACGIFRFTPGLRFPGHLSCGLLGVPVWKFALIDGLAALLTVPTQILLVSKYGDIILGEFRTVKIVILSLLTLFILYKLFLKVLKK